MFSKLITNKMRPLQPRQRLKILTQVELKRTYHLSFDFRGLHYNLVRADSR